MKKLVNFGLAVFAITVIAISVFLSLGTTTHVATTAVVSQGHKAVVTTFDIKGEYLQHDITISCDGSTIETSIDSNTPGAKIDCAGKTVDLIEVVRDAGHQTE